MKLIFVQLVIVCFLFACKSENTVEITVLKDTVSHNYLGNGVEWDPMMKQSHGVILYLKMIGTSCLNV